MIYLVIAFAFFFLLYYYDVCNGKKYKTVWYYVMLVVLVLLAGLRYRCGGDTGGYMEEYSNYPTLFEFQFSDFAKYRYQPLWIIYCVLLKTISANFVLQQLVNATIINYVLFTFIKKRSQYPFTVIFFYYIIFYLPFNFETMRESLAAAIFIAGFHFWEQKRWIPFLIIAFICFNIHVSASILFILPFLRNIRIRFKTFLIVLIGCGILAKVIFQLVFKNIVILSILSSGLEKNVTGEGISILENKGYNINYYILMWSQPLFILLCLFIYRSESLSLLIFQSKKLKKIVRYSNLIYLMFLFTALSSLSYIMLRFQNYIFVFTLIFLANFFVETIRRFRNLKAIYVAFFISVLVFSTVLNYNLNWYGNGIKIYRKYYPYYSVFNPKLNMEREGIISYSE